MQGGRKHNWLQLSIILPFLLSAAYGQQAQADSLKIDYKKFYSFCLGGDTKAALLFLTTYNNTVLPAKDSLLQAQFKRRFQGDTDNSDYLQHRDSPLNELLKVYQAYWRLSLLNKAGNYDTLLRKSAGDFLLAKNGTGSLITHEDSIDAHLKKYIESLGLHSTGFGKTGNLYDLLVWENEKDTTYIFSLHREKIRARVILMDNFITLGWEEYATLGRYYPGGWATGEALYCVKKGYDLVSEKFLISYLAHESRHFADYKLFPKLSGADLEYRAKLTELSMANKTLFEIISFFINNAKYDSDNSHSIANYCVLGDLSRILFKNTFEPDIGKWRAISPRRIHIAAYKLLKANTRALKLKGPEVSHYIKQ